MRSTAAVCEAIAGRRVLAVIYDGKARRIEPFCHGTNKEGADVVRAFQVGSSDGKTGWRMFIASRFANLTVESETFDEDRPGYNPDDKQMTRVHCCV